MKVNFNQAFKSFDGTTITETVEDDKGVKTKDKMISTMVAFWVRG